MQSPKHSLGWVRPSIRRRRTGAARWFAEVLTAGGFCGGLAVVETTAEPLAIVEAKRADAGLEVRWTAGAWSYEIRTKEDLDDPDWRLLLTTATNHTVVPIEGRAAFFRVAAIPQPPTTRRLAVTNELSGETATFVARVPSGHDAIFDGPAHLNQFDVHRLVMPAAMRAGFALRFDGAGGFVVLTNGVPAGQAGWYSVTAGPGSSEVTYTGSFTNQQAVFTFAATAAGPARSALLRHGRTASSGGAGSGTTGSVLEGLIGSAAWLWCLPGFAAQQVSCAGACANQAAACAFQFPPRASYCNWVTEITWPAGAQTPECLSRCEHGCK